MEIVINETLEAYQISATITAIEASEIARIYDAQVWESAAGTFDGRAVIMRRYALPNLQHMIDAILKKEMHP